MATATWQPMLASSRWRALIHETILGLAPCCARTDCSQNQSVWHRLRRRSMGVAWDAAWYCSPACMERALVEEFSQRASPAAPKVPVRHRLPLGLLLLSRQQITTEQLRLALAAQRQAGEGKLGEWLQRFGYANEWQVTTALARQWSCPVLREFEPTASRTLPQIPSRLLESFQMLPLEFAAATATLYVGCSDGIDYTVLYAIEQMLRCHVEPCWMAHSLFARARDAEFRCRRELEVVFHCISDGDEAARIVSSYMSHSGGSELRLVHCGRYFWVRLLRSSRKPIDLLLDAAGAVKKAETR